MAIRSLAKLELTEEELAAAKKKPAAKKAAKAKAKKAPAKKAAKKASKPRAKKAAKAEHHEAPKAEHHAGSQLEHHLARPKAKKEVKIGVWTIMAHEGESDGAVAIHGQEHHIFTGKSALSHAKEFAQARTDSLQKRKDAKPKANNEVVEGYKKKFDALKAKAAAIKNLKEEDEPNHVKRVALNKDAQIKRDAIYTQMRELADELGKDKKANHADMTAIVTHVTPYTGKTVVNASRKSAHAAMKRKLSNLSTDDRRSHKYADYVDNQKAKGGGYGLPA